MGVPPLYSYPLGNSLTKRKLKGPVCTVTPNLANAPLGFERGNCFPVAYVKPLCLVCIISIKDWGDVHSPSKVIWRGCIHQQTPVLNIMKPCEQCGSLRLTQTISKSLLLLLSRSRMNSALKITVFQSFLVCLFQILSFVVVSVLQKRWFPAGCDTLVSLLVPQTSLQWNKSWIKAI